MLNIYRIAGERLEAVDTDTLVPESTDAFWVDLISPGPEDRARIERARDVRLPKMSDLEQIKATSRFFVDEVGIHLRSWFLESCGEQLVTHAVGFVVSDSCLISLRSKPSQCFDLLADRHQLGRGEANPMGVFLTQV